MTSVEGSKRTRAAHLGPERRRPMVRDAAFKAFLERGYQRTSMAEVARRAGLSKPVVYDCFPSKEALFAAVQAKLEESLLTEVSAALLDAIRAGTDAERSATAGFIAFLEAVARSPNAFRYIYSPVHGLDDAGERHVAGMRAATLKAFTKVVLPAVRVERGADPEAKARLVAHAIAGLAESAARALLAEPERWSPSSMGAMLGRLLVRGTSAL